MSLWKSRVEKGFGALAEQLYQYPKRYLFSVFMVVALLATQLQYIYMDTSTEGFLSPDHPAIKTYDRFREQFGRDELIIVGAKTDNVLQPEFVAQFRQLFDHLSETLPNTETVDSMINARYVYGEEDELVVEDLFEPWPEQEKDFAEIRRRIENNDLYKGLVVNQQYSLATIIIRLQYLPPDESLDVQRQQAIANAQTETVLQALDAALQPYRDQGMELYVAGSPTVTSLLRNAMMTDMQTFSKWVVFAICLLLFLLFRRFSGVIFPLIAVLLSVAFTVSLMGLFRQPLQLPTAMLPTFILVVGIGDSIHFLSLFYSEFNRHGDKKQALIDAMEHAGLAMFLTSLTTAAGMISFANAKLLPISNLGVFTAAGVMVAFLITILVLPAAISLTPIKPKGHNKSPHNAPFLNRLIDGAAHISYHYPKSIIAVCAIIFVSSGVLISHMQFSHNPLKWMPDTMFTKQSISTIDRDLGGSISLEVVVDTKEENGIYQPQFLRNLDELCQQLKAFKTDQFHVNKVLSITDLLKESNRALHGNEQAYYAIPDNRALVAQELFLLEISGSEDLFRLVNREYSKARITLTLPWIDTLLYAPLMDNLEQRFQDKLGNQYQIAITGLIPLLGSTLNSVIHSAAEAYIIALIVISIIMMMLLGSFKLGMVSMFPNILPILMVMGLMQLTGVPFDMFTILIGSIAIGLCVDDTVHFMHHFSRFREKGNDVKQAIENTLHTAGRAMLVTSIVLCSGFMVLTLSQLNNFTNFGLYSSLCILLALAADFLLAPALMTVLNRQ